MLWGRGYIFWVSLAEEWPHTAPVCSALRVDKVTVHIPLALRMHQSFFQMAGTQLKATGTQEGCLGSLHWKGQSGRGSELDPGPETCHVVSACICQLVALSAVVRTTGKGLEPRAGGWPSMMPGGDPVLPARGPFSPPHRCCLHQLRHVRVLPTAVVTRSLLPTVLEARGPRSGSPWGLSAWLADSLCPHTAVSLCLFVASSPPLLRTPVRLRWRHPCDLILP